MATETPNWALYRTLLAVIRERSLSGAARRLQLAQPTVGRQIAELEQELGVPLFLRSPGGMQPTDAALRLVPHAEVMAHAADALVRAASGTAEDESGTIRLTASEIVGVELLVPMLASFRERYPAIQIELVLSSRTEDLLRGEADVAVRLYRPTQQALIARQVAILELGLYAHPRYVARHGVARSRAQLAGHALIGFDSEALIRRTDRHGLAFTRDASSLRCDSYVGQYAALKAGLGIGTCLVAMARRDGLARVLPRVRAEVELWLVMHEDLRTRRRVRLLYDFLGAELVAYARTGRQARAGSKTTA